MKTISSLLLTALVAVAPLFAFTSTASAQSSYSLQDGIRNYQTLQVEFGPNTTVYYYFQGYIDVYEQLSIDLAEDGDYDEYDFSVAVATYRSIQYQFPVDSDAYAYFDGCADTYQLVIDDLAAGMIVTQ